MGVPKFFRFISERYPLINCPLPANPPQIDNLYLDMNGIIHNCVRSSPGSSTVDTKRYTSLPADRTPADIFLDVFKYIDNLVASLPPRRVLYMAIDGVAPRAKMNQQRSRRFRSAKERVQEHLKRQAEDPMYAAADIDPFDSNCITPGTHFMAQLTVALRYFVARKISEDPSWSHLQIVLSGAEAPGEGEHKIMAYIRAQREAGLLDANTRHAVYGLDADLIMLALITHEPHFFLLREKIDFGAFWRRGKSGPRVATSLDMTRFGEFELFSINILREYIEHEVGMDGNSSLPYFNVDRITDDFVFILMLIGNDFLPNLPTLDIADGTLSVMLHLYRRLLPYLGGYITHTGKIHAPRFEYMLAKLAMLEEHILRHRREESPSGRGGGGRRRGGGNRTKSFLTDLDQMLDFAKPDPSQPPAAFTEIELARATEEIRARLAQTELVRLKEEYYTEKFGATFGQNPDAVRDLVAHYMTGVSWTLKYYTEGCRLWRWFYPYHYAPLASDIIDIGSVLQKCEDNDEIQAPFKPFEQLLSVLPPASSWCLPKPYRYIMTSPASPLADQYPADFAIDMNGKRNDWEAVVLLPFVDETSLLNVLKTIPVSDLEGEELHRNQHGPSTVFTYSSSYSEEVESPFGARLPSFTSRAQPRQLELPPIQPGTPFSATPYPGTMLPGSCEELADLPTMRNYEFKAKLQSVGVNVFGMPSRNDSLVLIMDKDNLGTGGNIPDNGTPPKAAPSYLDQSGITVGSAIWFGLPWRKAGTVESISSRTMTKRLVQVAGADRNQPLTPHVNVSATLGSEFEQNASAIVSLLLQKTAISAGRPEQVVVIRSDEPSKPADKDNDDFSDRVHERFIEVRSGPKNGLADKPLAVGQSVMYVGHGAYFGHKCTVVSQLGYDLVRVQFDKPINAAREPPFGYRVVSLTQTQRWFPLSRLAAELGSIPAMVDTFLGSVRVRLSSDREEIDLGLGVKYIGRGLFVVGYARRDERNHYSFSEKTLDVLRKYKAAFPALFEAIEKSKKDDFRAGSSGGRSKGALVFTSSELFPGKHSDDAVRAAAAWLSVQEVATQPLVSANAEVLSPEKVNELERHCQIIQALQDDYEASLGGKDPLKSMRDVTRASLITGSEGPEWGNPTETENGLTHHFEPVPTNAAGLRLGDRVANRLARGGVPFAMRGTVVGIHPGEVDSMDNNAIATAAVEVVFDGTFISGGNLSGKCSDGRGKAVQADSLFIIRPERDNPYYTKHYARVAARVGLMLKRNQEQEPSKRSVAIAKAALSSYADVLKGKPKDKQLKSATSLPGAAPPADVQPAAVQPVAKQAHASTSSAASLATGSRSGAPTTTIGNTMGSSKFQGRNSPDWPRETFPTTTLPDGIEEAGKREAPAKTDARVASVGPPSWVGGRGSRGGRDRGRPNKQAGGGPQPRQVANQAATPSPMHSTQGTTSEAAPPVTRARQAEVDRLSEQLKKAIGVGQDTANAATTPTGGGSRRRRNRNRTRGRGGGSGTTGVTNVASGSGGNGGIGGGAGITGVPISVTTATTTVPPAVVGDEFELVSKWDELQEREKATRQN